MVPLEFQAVVLAAGRGTRLPELCSEHPKCLLTLGPYPLLWYPLNTLQKHNFHDVIVIVLESQKNQIQQVMDKTPLEIKIEYVTISNDVDWGTADSLRYIHDKIKTNVIVMSCDVVTNTSLYPLFNIFRQHNATLTSLIFDRLDTSAAIPGPKIKHKVERDLIGIQEKTQRLLFLASTSDFEESVDINTPLLKKYKKLNIYSRLVDSHIYVIRKWVFDFLKKKDTFCTLKGEFLPYIIKKQMAKNSVQAVDAPSEAKINVKSDNNIFEFIPHTNLEDKITNASIFNESRTKQPYFGDLIRCYAIQIPEDFIGMRINTTVNYYTANMNLFTVWSQFIDKNENASLISPNAIVKSTQTNDISVADNTTLCEKTSLKLSVFGFNCIINPRVRISNSIIMNHVVIEEKCIIENCIICDKAIIKTGSVLQNCIVGPNYIVEESTNRQSVHLTNADGFMEIE